MHCTVTEQALGAPTRSPGRSCSHVEVVLGGFAVHLVVDEEVDLVVPNPLKRASVLTATILPTCTMRVGVLTTVL